MAVNIQQNDRPKFPAHSYFAYSCRVEAHYYVSRGKDLRVLYPLPRGMTGGGGHHIHRGVGSIVLETPLPRTCLNEDVPFRQRGPHLGALDGPPSA